MALLNFLVNYPKGKMFIKFIDASTHVKDVSLSYEFVDGFIQYIVLQHVVQRIHDNETNYMISRKFLMKRTSH